VTTNENASRDVVEEARVLSQELATASSGNVAAVILYGSHLLNARPDRHSAYDFVVIVDSYRAFYGSLKAAGEIHRPAWLMSLAARVLPPNAIAFTPDEGRRAIAKCLVVSRDHFRRAVSRRPRDHFLLGRMVQKVAVVWRRDDESARWVEDHLDAARRGVMEWVSPYLDEEFDAASVGRRLLAVCYRGEFRPEAGNRSDTIFEAQRSHFEDVLGPVLEEGAQAGRLARVGDSTGRYRFVTPQPWRARLRWRWHFIRSKARVTARWPKHVLTFDNWLPYILRKVERRTGMRVELTSLERRLPLIFLWPKVVRVLRARPAKE
jgi:hypothetical protein